jgi:hypothetical protein
MIDFPKHSGMWQFERDQHHSLGNWPFPETITWRSVERHTWLGHNVAKGRDLLLCLGRDDFVCRIRTLKNETLLKSRMGIDF